MDATQDDALRKLDRLAEKTKFYFQRDVVTKEQAFAHLKEKCFCLETQIGRIQRDLIKVGEGIEEAKGMAELALEME